MDDPTCVQGWSQQLLALHEFILTDARIDEHIEPVAHIEPPRDVQACSECGAIE